MWDWCQEAKQNLPCPGKRRRGSTEVCQTPQSLSAKHFPGRKAINALGHLGMGDREYAYPNVSSWGGCCGQRPSHPYAICHQCPQVTAIQGEPLRCSRHHCILDACSILH